MLMVVQQMERLWQILEFQLICFFTICIIPQLSIYQNMSSSWMMLTHKLRQSKVVKVMLQYNNVSRQRAFCHCLGRILKNKCWTALLPLLVVTSFLSGTYSINVLLIFGCSILAGVALTTKRRHGALFGDAGSQHGFIAWGFVNLPSTLSVMCVSRPPSSYIVQRLHFVKSKQLPKSGGSISDVNIKIVLFTGALGTKASNHRVMSFL